MLENTIKSGMLGQLTQVMEAVNNKSPQKTKIMMMAQTQGYQESDYRTDIPLREPLDPEYRLNRKLAKQIYNKERNEKVKMHKELIEI